MQRFPVSHAEAVITCEGLQALIDALAERGYQVLGPTVHDGAIVYDAVRRVEELPAGWTDHQEPGRYRLARRDDAALFGFAVGPQAWKRFLHPPIEALWTIRQGDDGVAISSADTMVPRYAFLGVRACELHAILIQDRVLRDGQYPDAAYMMRRQDAFIVAVNCEQPGGTCFCVSMRTGPKAESGYDLALTELVLDGGSEFLVRVGTEAGAELLSQVPHQAATEQQVSAAAVVVAHAAGQMGRRLDTDGLKELLQRNPHHPRWDEVAARCLSCGNCTMVCPTCFCSSVEESSDLAGVESERTRRWDSCFTMDHSYIHGGSVRPSARSRYRQWMTHKLATWVDQFGSSGCVGCGRCITWCPVGIDITEEVRAIRAGEPH